MRGSVRLLPRLSLMEGWWKPILELWEGVAGMAREPDPTAHAGARRSLTYVGIELPIPNRKADAHATEHVATVAVQDDDRVGDIIPPHHVLELLPVLELDFSLDVDDVAGSSTRIVAAVLHAPNLSRPRGGSQCHRACGSHQ